MKLKIESIPVDSLTLDPANVRTHPERNLETIKASLLRFGQQKPIVVNKDGVVIAGNGTLQAARALNWPEIDIVRSNLIGPEATAFAIADNRTAELAEWDDAALAETLAALQADEDVDHLAAGFTDDEIEELVGKVSGLGPDETVEDEAPEPEGVAVSREGDVWQCGPHRVVCGDSTSQAVVAAVLGSASPIIMVTDPPYGVEYDPKWRREVEAIRKGDDATATYREGVVENDDNADWEAAYGLFPGDVAYVWHAGIHAGTVAIGLHKTDFQIRAQIVWNKQSLVMGRGAYHWKHEPCWYSVRKGQKASWTGDRKQSTVWDIPTLHRTQGTTDDGVTQHGTQKPVECMARPIRNHDCRRGVYDPFLGSGTTLIAAEQQNVPCFGVELNPIYVDVIVRRWQNFTGEKATLDGDGRSFEDVAAERLEIPE